MQLPRPDPIVELEPGVRRVLAPNPSPMTHWGTNTYILGEGKVAVIDPGPADATHLDQIKSALKPGEQISHIFVTHSHLDHSPLAKQLSEHTGAPVLAFGDSFAGRSDMMNQLALNGDVGGGEGVDASFKPEEIIADDQEITGADWSLRTIWTPGHFGNHLSFAFGDAVFTGDHIMDWSSSLVSPPDGDLTAFMASTRLLANRNDRVFYPGHGNPVANPQDRANWLLNHRMGREAQILEQLETGSKDAATITKRIYIDIPPALIPAAERNVFAHLIDLTQQSRITSLGDITFTAKFKQN